MRSLSQLFSWPLSRWFSRALVGCVACSAAACEKSPPSLESDKPAVVSATAPSANPEKLWAQAGSSANLPVPAPPDVEAPPADAVRSPSGLASKIVQAGTGTEHPQPWDTVRVHYTGWTTDGKMFDNTRSKGRPVSMPADSVSTGWTEALQQMVVGEKRLVWIPEELAKRAKPGTPPGMLVFEIELLDIRHEPKPVPAPPDVAAPPADAIKTPTGLASKVLQPGKGTTHPSETSQVKVHYTGWTTDGKMFDSSVLREQPATFTLQGVIAGWTEGVQLMVEGEKRRFWIPQELAYKGRPGAPAGMLVFDVELLAILPPKAAPSASFSPAAGPRASIVAKPPAPPSAAASAPPAASH